MQFLQNNTAVPETNLPNWQPINQKQFSYRARLNQFVTENTHDCSHNHSHMCNHQHHHHHHWTPNMGQNGYNQRQEMNTWTEDSISNLQTHYQNFSEQQSPGPFKKMRPLSNEHNKMQRYVSDFQVNGQQVQQSHFGDFSQNQNTVHRCGGHKLHNINLKDESISEAFYNQNPSSASASTNDNSNSDVEIIEDDYAKSLQNIPNLIHSKSTIVPHQTRSDYVQQPFQLAKMQSTYSTFKNDNFDDVSSYTGDATRPTQKKRFVNREERQEFNQKIEKMKKTEMCRNIIMYQHCKYGDACSYAHNADELVAKQHLPSNYKTKLCQQYHEEGYCQYGQRCQFLHSIYDLSDKHKLSYKKGLAEEARLTWQRIQQGSDCIMVNILKGKGCVAPDERLPCFVQIYNKEDYKAELLKKEQERQSKGFSNSYGNQFDRYSSQMSQYNNNKQNTNFQQFSYVQRKSEPWSNKVFQNNSWEQQQYFDNGSGYKTNYRRYQNQMNKQ